jgi:hypothetical protein
MRRRISLAAVVGSILLLLLAQGLAQPNPDTLWTRTYGGGYGDYTSSVQQTVDGGYIVAGSGTRGCDFYLVKMNSQGDTLWARCYGGLSDDNALSVQQTADGGYIVAGATDSFGAGSYDFYLVKTNSQGDTLWTRTYGGGDYEAARSVRQTADGGYVLAGSTMSFGAGYEDCYLVKTNEQGDTLWTRTYGGSSDDRAYSVQQAADGGYVVAGWTRSFGASLYETMYLVKTDGQGDTLWTRTYGGGREELAHSVQLTADGGYVLAGLTDSYGAGDEDFYLVKITSEGDTLWTRTYGGYDRDEALSVQQTSDGGYVVGGITYSFGAGTPVVAYMYLVKTGPDISETEPARITTPNEYILYPAFPNPFNPSAQIVFALPKASEVSLRVFNLLGQEVATLAVGLRPAGTHAVTFDGSGLPTGIYFYHLDSGDFIQTRKMVLLK